MDMRDFEYDDDDEVDDIKQSDIIEHQQAEIERLGRGLGRMLAKKEKQQAEIDKLKANFNNALDRLWDMSLQDDGQAEKEAEKFYSQFRDDWNKPK